MATPTKATKAAPVKRAVKAPVKAAKVAAPVKAAVKKAAKAVPAPVPAPGWYPDPADTTTKRYWDGEGWLGAPLPADIVSEETPSTEAPTTITWQDRVMSVRRPSPGMIGVWQLAAREFSAVTAKTSVTGEEAADAAARLIRVCTSVLTSPDDKGWVMDLLLDNTVALEQVADVLSLTVVAFQEQDQAAGNRQERRAAASKARRR